MPSNGPPIQRDSPALPTTMKPIPKNKLLALAFGLACLGSAHVQAKKPNVLIIWGDDIGQFNVGAYNMGMMGYKTPNIDSIG